MFDWMGRWGKGPQDSIKIVLKKHREPDTAIYDDDTSPKRSKEDEAPRRSTR